MAEVPITRERLRITSLSIDKSVIAERIKRFYDDDHTDRGPEIDARLQRYAKFRMWTEGKNWPWADATDAAIPDMMTASMRMQDTLHNAVMASRPPIGAKAARPTDKEKEKTIDHLLDFQFFEEQPGESIVGQLADDFVNEGLFTVYTPWISEQRRATQVKIFPAIPQGMEPGQYFATILQGFFPQGVAKVGSSGWDFTIQDGKKRAKAAFFTKAAGDPSIEMDLETEVEVFNGPRALRKDVQDVLHPARCENLQIQSPSNPTGAAHVIVRDFPNIDELRRLHQSGYYDLLSDEDAEKLGLLVMDEDHQEREEQKDVLQGVVQQRDLPKDADSHRPLTRLMCFDCYDIDGDGLDEDVVFWMILEDKIILKAVYLSQVFPSDPPRRPFAEAGLFPVPGRRLAIGLLEMMEGLHDLMKQFFDQGGDAGTLANAPFGFYRQTSSMKPEQIRLWPGEMYPLSDPKNDVSFPQLGNQNQAFTFNMVTMLTQIEERLTNIGDLQLGRVPQGKASALRTVSGMQTVLSQGDARPERVLRRFFMGLAQVWENFHALDEVLLPPKKRFMLSGPIDPRDDPYKVVGDATQIKGKFRFTFSANVLNTSKEAMQQALTQLMASFISPMAIQMKIINPDGVYRLLRDYGRSLGQDPDRYLSPPSPEAMQAPISAEEAILTIMNGDMPKGSPMEGLEDHFEKLRAFFSSDEFGYLGAAHIPLFKHYFQEVAQAVAQEKAQAAMLQAAQQHQMGAGPQGMPGPVPGPQPGGGQATPMVQQGELMDESLPGAGGGANPGVPA